MLCTVQDGRQELSVWDDGRYCFLQNCLSSNDLESLQNVFAGCWATYCWLTCSGVCRSQASWGSLWRDSQRTCHEQCLPLSLTDLDPPSQAQAHMYANSHTIPHSLSLPAQALRSSLFIMSGGMLPLPVTTMINDNVQTWGNLLTY